MRYTVTYTKQALRDLKKLDRATAALLLGWIEKNLVGCENPRQHGKGLSANLTGLWRYRVSDYRLIAEISEETICITMLNIGHRREIYKGF